MKNHSRFLKTTTIGICVVFGLFGLLLGTQLLTKESNAPLDWQTTLLSLVIHHSTIRYHYWRYHF